MNEIYVFIGILGWILLHLASTKDRYDSGGRKFHIKKYFDKSWDNWLFSIAGGYVFYYAFPLLWILWFNYKGKEAPELVDFYAPLCGFFGGFILQKMYRLIKKFSNGSK